MGYPVAACRGRTNVASSAFTPASLPGIASWYDGDYRVESDGSGTLAVAAGTVQRWVNRINEAQYLDQQTLNFKPIYRVGANGIGYLESDGTNDSMARTFTSASQPQTLFCCVCPKRNASGGLQYVVDGGSTGRHIIYANTGTPGKWSYFAGSAQNSTADYTVDQWFRVIAVFNGASSKLIVNGTTVSTANPGSNGTEGETIFSDNIGSNCAQAFMSQFGRVSGALSSGDITLLDAFLLSKVPT